MDLRWYWEVFRVPPHLSVAEWAEKYRYLSPESSAEPGKWHNSRAPYQKGFMDAINDPRYEYVVWMSSSQVGKTEGGGLNLLGYFIDYDPCPILVVLPNIEVAREFSKTRLAGMLRDTPRLRGKVKETRGKQAKSEGSSNETLHKTFPGGHLTLVGSNSPSGLASKPIRVVYIDELDRFEASAGSEGDQVELAKRRTETFWNRKVVLTSTPGVKGISRIEFWYEASNQQKYYVPCPHCRTLQVLQFRNLLWDKDDKGRHLYQTAHFVCEYCQQAITQRHKARLLAEGEWIADNPDPACTIAGFHIWAGYSPWKTWASIAEDYVRAKRRGRELLQTFTNTILGESWEEEGEALQWQTLAQRAEPIKPGVVPDGALFLTAGIDVQADRVEVSVWGWGLEEEAWLIEHQVIFGDVEEDETTAELDTYLERSWPQPTKQRQLSLVLATMDTGYKTQAVYRYVRTRERVYATKGSSTLTAARVARPTKQDVDHFGTVIKAGLDLWSLGVYVLKATLYSRFRLPEAGPRYVHFPQDLDEEYYKQLTAERLVSTYNKGHVKREWHKIRPRNEALDCAVLAYAAALIAGMERIDWSKVGPAAAKPPPPLKKLIVNPGPRSARPVKKKSTPGGTLQRLLHG